MSLLEAQWGWQEGRRTHLSAAGNFLEIKPLDLSPMPDARQHSLDSLHLPGMGLGTPKSARKVRVTFL